MEWDFKKLDEANHLKIILVGYMGSGKSFISQKISKLKNIQRVDLDEYITQKEQKTITDIFNNQGTVIFRNLERKYLLELLQKDEDMILSVGGGTPCFGDNIQLMNNNGKTFYLNTPLNVLYERLKNEKIHRPLIANLKDLELKEFITKHLFERKVFYEKAKFTINTNQNISKIIKQILEVIN